MSSSSRKLGGAGRQLTAAGVVAMISAAPAGAAEFYYQPIVSLATAYNTNLDLTPVAAEKRGAEGYYADAATTIGIATPQSETNLQPRLLYNYYPSATDRDRLEAFLTGSSRYSWQRDRFNISGYYDHRDDIQAEIEEERRFVEAMKAKAGPSRLQEILEARKANGPDNSLPPG